MNVQKVYYMINTVLQLSTPALIVGGLACSTLIPAIEAALRAIFASGQLLHNRCQYCYAKVAFRPEKSFTTSPEYKIARDCLMKHITVSENSKLPDSCTYDINKPNSKLKLIFRDQSFELDKEQFKQYSVYYKNMSEDFNEFNDKIGSDADNQTEKCMIPEIFTEKSFHLLTSYLTKKPLFNKQSPELRKLDLEKFIDLYKLAIYLHIPDLEARCVRIIKEYIDDGRIDIDQFDDVAKDGKYNEKYNIEDEAFRNLLVEIKNFKKTYYNQELKNRITLLDQKKNSIVIKISEQFAIASVLIIFSLVPIVGPALVHFRVYGDKFALSSYSLFLSNAIVLGACVMGGPLVLAVTVNKIASFALASLTALMSPSQLITLLVIIILTRR